MIFGPLQFFTSLADQITEMTNSAQRMFEVLDTPRDIVDTKDPVKLEGMKGEIEFEEVCFHYLANRPILRNMSFKIKQGDYIGLVGHTGAGKSTIANLITRMYDVISGSIKIDGHNIKDIEIQTLRKNIAIVSQEIFIFRGTVAENIRYAKPNATRDEIIAASKAANAHDFISNMPEGYETLVGTGSRSMSGGEQQRISIARALLLDPKILILDEATAAMDTETERQIQEAINVLVKGRTTIVIAHRLSTLKECNYLFAIENGEVAESGDHLELIKNKGIYYKLYKLQSDAMKRVIAGE
jgi:ATP-binding cassette subfamily B protein